MDLLGQTFVGKAVGYSQTGRMVGQGHIIIVLVDGSLDHDFYRILAVAPIAVEMQIAPEIGFLHQTGQSPFYRRLHLPKAKPQLRRNVWETKAGVKGNFVGEALHLSGFQVGDPVLVQREAHVIGVVPKPQVVLLTAGKVLEHSAEGIWFADP